MCNTFDLSVYPVVKNCNRRWNNQNTIWCLQNDTTFSKLITHPSKPNISIKTYNLCSIENVCFLIYLTMDNKTQTTAININLWNHHFNFCATPSQYWLFYHWQHTTIWVLYWALLLREYTVRKYLKSENLYTEKYCCSVFVLLNTIHVKYILNKDLSTPLIYICSTVYKMAKILTQKYLLQSFFHITCIYCKKSKWQVSIYSKKVKSVLQWTFSPCHQCGPVCWFCKNSAIGCKYTVIRILPYML